MLKNKTVHIVIMAGGSGKRLWPLSRSGKPKQFIKFNSEKTLLEETVDRVKNIFENQKILVVTAKNFENFVDRLVGDSIDKIIVEPESKNTAPAVLYSCLNLQADSDDVVIFLPSDHHITDFKKFRESIEQSARSASETNGIILVGIKPTYPATGYGYIEINLDNNIKTKTYFEVEKFHEKPNITLAQKYFNSKNMLWNSGIICAKFSVLLDAYKNLFPSLDTLSSHLCASSSTRDERDNNVVQVNKNFVNLCEERSFVSDSKFSTPLVPSVFCNDNEEKSIEGCECKYIYNIIPEISFDYAILEKTKNLNVIKADFSWSDIGTLDVFIAAKKDINNKENLVSIESENNLVEVQNKLVVLVGIHDLCIVETDDVLLISTKKDIDKVKDVISELNSSGKKEYC